MRDRKSSGGGAALLVVAAIAAAVAIFMPGGGAAGAAKAILKIVLLVLAAIAVLTVVILIFALHKPSGGAAEQKEPKPDLSKENEALLTQARSNLAQLRAMAARIRSPQIRAKCTPICDTAGKILKALREQPEDIPTVRKFFNYYLPTLGKILTKYEYLERSHAPLEEMNEKVSGYLDQIQSAMERQYANLFEDDLLDMTAEMQTMTAVCRKDGLLTDDGIDAEGRDGTSIRLTL